MHGLRRIYLLTFVVAVAAVTSLAFNVDMMEPRVYRGEQKKFFGYKALPVLSGREKGIIITAPLNGSGLICRYDNGEPTNCFHPNGSSLPNTTVVTQLGMSIAADSKGSHFTVCSPSVVHECNENSYIHSVCYKLTDKLQQVANFTPAFQECTKQTVDLVFLFDGSRSMTEVEFNKNKDFIVVIMNSLKNTSIKFAAVQFSSQYNQVFDFKDFEAGTAVDKLMKEPHMKDLTNTHKALTYVLYDIFENPEAGATPDSTKVLVLITDGDPSDLDRNKTIAKYDEKGIIRLVIGVKDAKLDKFKDIASEPKDKNAFKIENYDGLTGILENFQKRIFTMEGSKVAQAGNMTNEMSQSGFSAASYKDTLVLGSVGTNTWKGSLQEFKEKKETQIQDNEMEMDSYMGYSVSIGQKSGKPLYFTGAPRSEHNGQVVLFSHNGNNWTVFQRIKNDQIGSYFGAELCTLDINSDNDTDFLLVGAPLFYQPHEKKEGRIYIYKLTDEPQLKMALNVTAPSMGRFGSTISSLADLNGDGLRDVAVGAPLEDDNRGAVYIYLGDRHKGIRSIFSQRITGTKIDREIRFFGQSINGDFDLGEDGLPDIVVGSQGFVAVLRSKPVFDVISSLSYHPAEINTEKFECPAKTDVNLHMVTVTVCFNKKEATKSTAANSGVKISYTLAMDPTRPIYRGFFNQTDKKTRNLTSTCELTANKTCFNHSIFMPKCVRDTLLPLAVKLNFSQAESESSGTTLNADSTRQSSVDVPFTKHCRKNDTCIAELTVDFNFGSPTLLVKDTNNFKVSINLTNHGDDSYNTSLTMHYPPGLSFSTMLPNKSTRSTLHSCHDLEGVFNKTICSISVPVFPSRSYATFDTDFRVLNNHEWDDTASMKIVGNSDNAVSSKNMSMTKTIPVQYEIKMAIILGDSVTYMNFTAEDAAPKKMVATYKISNIGFKHFPVNVTLSFTPKLGHEFEIYNYKVLVQENQTTCRTELKPYPCSPNTTCTAIVCESFNLEKDTEFKLLGDVQFKNLKEQAANIPFLKRYTGDNAEVKFKSFIEVKYDTDRYVLASNKHEEKSHNSGPAKRKTDVRIELIFPPDNFLICATGVGLGFLFLIIATFIMFKLGCFKRKKFEDCQDRVSNAEENAPLQATVCTSKTDIKSDEVLDEKASLAEAKKNGGSQSAEDPAAMN